MEKLLELLQGIRPDVDFENEIALGDEEVYKRQSRDSNPGGYYASRYI